MRACRSASTAAGSVRSGFATFLGTSRGNWRAYPFRARALVRRSSSKTGR